MKQGRRAKTPPPVLRHSESPTLSRPAFSRLETCSLVATAGSHDSGPVLSSGDVATSCEDVLGFDDQFYCKECGTYVSVDRFVNHDDKIYCKCGKKYLEWKE